MVKLAIARLLDNNYEIFINLSDTRLIGVLVDKIIHACIVVPVYPTNGRNVVKPNVITQKDILIDYFICVEETSEFVWMLPIDVVKDKQTISLGPTYAKYMVERQSSITFLGYKAKTARPKQLSTRLKNKGKGVSESDVLEFLRKKGSNDES